MTLSVSDQRLLATLKAIKQERNMSAIPKEMQPLALALAFIEKNCADTLPLAAIFSENVATQIEYEREQIILLTILKDAINLRLDGEDVKCNPLNDQLLRACYLRQYNTLVTDTKPLRQIHSTIGNLDITGKFLQGTLHGQEWLTDADLGKLAARCGLKDIMHFCPLDAATIGLVLHFARASAVATASQEYAIPMLLNLGNNGNVTDQGRHWTRVLFVIKTQADPHTNQQTTTVTVKFRDTFDFSKDKQEQIQAVLSEAINYQEASGTKLYRAFPSSTVTFDIAADQEKQRNGWECGYLAFQRLLNDPDFQRFCPAPVVPAEPPSPRTKITSSATLEALRDTVYETLLSGISLSQEELAQIRLKDKEKFFISPSTSGSSSESQTQLQIAPSSLTQLIKLVGTIAPSAAGSASISLENLQIEEQASKLELEYTKLLDPKQEQISLDLEKIFPKTEDQASLTEIVIQSRLRALIRLLNKHPGTIKIFNCGCLPKKACVQTELDNLLKLVEISQGPEQIAPIEPPTPQEEHAEQSLVVPKSTETESESYKYLQIIQARNTLIARVGLSSKIDPQGNIWQQLWLARLTDASLFGDAAQEGRDQFSPFSFHQTNDLKTKPRASVLIETMGARYLQGLLDCFNHYGPSLTGIAKKFVFNVHHIGYSSHGVKIIPLETLQREKEYLQTLQTHFEKQSYVPFNILAFKLGAFSPEVTDGRFAVFLNLLQSLPTNNITKLELSFCETFTTPTDTPTECLSAAQYDELIKIFNSKKLRVELVISKISDDKLIQAKNKELGNVIARNRRAFNIAQRTAKTKSQEAIQPASAPSLPKVGERRYKFNPQHKPTCEISVEQQAEQQHQHQTQLQQEQQQQTQVQQQQQSATEDFSSSANTSTLISKEDYCSEDNTKDFFVLISSKKCPALSLYISDPTRQFHISAEHYWQTAISSSAGKLPNSIALLTPSAANQLTTNPTVFIGGLNIDNLPSGFFVQRAKDGKLILNYDAARYTENKNKSPLTINPITRDMDDLLWLGDVTQFNVDLGPKTKNFYGILECHPGGQLIDPQKATLEIFTILAKSLNPALAQKIFKDHNWCLVGSAGKDQATFRDGTNMLALIDLLYHEGCEGVAVFLDALKNLHDKNPALYLTFKECFIDGKQKENPNQSIMSLMTAENLAIIAELSNLRGPEAAWWIELVTQHSEQIAYPDLTQLYNGFKYFLNQLPQNATLPLVCPIKKSNNMLATLDRLLATLGKVNGRNLHDQMQHLADLDLTQDGAWYAARWERFHFFHAAMHLSPQDINPEFEDQILGRQTLTYRVDYEQLRQMALTKKTNLTITTTTKKTTKTENVPIDVTYPTTLFHRFVGCSDKISDNYNLYIQLTEKIAAAQIPLKTQEYLLALFAITTTGERGYNFTLEECDQLLSFIEHNTNGSNAQQLNSILETLVAKLEHTETKPNVTELTGLIKLIFACEWREDVAQNIATILDTKNLSPKIWQAIALWDANTQHIEADDFLDTFELLKEFDIDHLSELAKIIGLLKEKQDGSITTKQAVDFYLLPELRKLKEKNAAVYEKAIQILSYIDLQKTEHTLLPTVDDLTNAIKSLADVDDPNLVFVRLKTNLVLSRCSFDMASNLDIPPFDFNSTVLAKIAELNEFLEQYGLAPLDIEQLKNGDDEKVKGYIIGFTTVVTAAIQAKLGHAGWTIAQSMVYNKLIEGLKGILFTDIAQTREKFPALYAALQDKFPEPKVSGYFVKIAEDYITLRNYPASIEGLLAALVALQKKWPNFSLQLFLNSPIFNQFNAAQLKDIFQAIGALDVSYLPTTLFTCIFGENSFAVGVNPEEIKNHIVKIIGLLQFNVTQKAKLISIITVQPSLADDLIKLFQDIQTNHAEIANQIFTLLTNGKNILGQKLIADTQSLLSLLIKDPANKEIKEIIFNKLADNFTDFAKLLVYLNSLPDEQQKLNFLKIIAYSCLERDYTAETQASIFGDNDAHDTSTAKKIAELVSKKQDAELVKLYQERPFPGLNTLNTFLATKTDQQSTFLQTFYLDPPGKRKTPQDITEQFDTTISADRIDAIIDMRLGSFLPLSEREKLYEQFLYVNEVGYSSAHPLRVPQTDKTIIADAASYQKPAKDLTKIQIRDLINHYKQIISDASAPEAIKTLAKLEFAALIREVMYRTTGRFPRSTQMISLLNVMMHGGNSFSEIRTGEGKGLITCLYAMSQWVKGDTVDVCSANMELARRDLQEHGDFYEYLGIKTSLISAQSAHQHYQKDGIHYSDVSELALFQERMELEHHALPEKRSLVLDECDFNLLDNTTQFRYATSLDPSYDPHFNPNAWAYPTIIAFVEDPIFKQKIEHGDGVSVSELQDFAMHSSLLSPDQKAHFSRFSDIQLYNWINAAYTAMHLREQEDFVVRNTTMSIEGQEIPVQVAQVKIHHRVSPKSQFSDGVHQFLHTRLNLEMEQGKRSKGDNFPIEPEKTYLASRSVKNFVDSYFAQGNILGLTGTIGSPEEIAEMRAKYAFTFYRIPPHQELRRIDHDPIIARHGWFSTAKENYLQTILEHVQLAIRRNQPVLLLCENVAATEEVFAYLAQHGLTEQNLQIYNGEQPALQEETVVQRAGKMGMVTVATPMLGRGTDIKPESEHGLCVIDTFIAADREYGQKIGRAGRNGNKGDSYLIICEDEFKRYGKAIPSTSKADAVIATIRKQLNTAKKEEREEKQFVADIKDQFFQGYIQTCRALKGKIEDAFKLLVPAIAQTATSVPATAISSSKPSSANDQAAKEAWQSIQHETFLLWEQFLRAFDDKWKEINEKSDKTLPDKIDELTAFANALWPQTLEQIKAIANKIFLEQATKLQALQKSKQPKEEATQAEKLLTLDLTDLTFVPIKSTKKAPAPTYGYAPLSTLARRLTPPAQMNLDQVYSEIGGLTDNTKGPTTTQDKAFATEIIRVYKLLFPQTHWTKQNTENLAGNTAFREETLRAIFKAWLDLEFIMFEIGRKAIENGLENVTEEEKAIYIKGLEIHHEIAKLFKTIAQYGTQENKSAIYTTFLDHQEEHKDNLDYMLRIARYTSEYQDSVNVTLQPKTDVARDETGQQTAAWRTLYQYANQELNNYGATWFKSNDRIERLTDLQRKLNEINRNDKTPAEKTKQLILALDTASEQAYQADHIADDSRWRYSLRSYRNVDGSRFQKTTDKIRARAIANLRTRPGSTQEIQRATDNTKSFTIMLAHLIQQARLAKLQRITLTIPRFLQDLKALEGLNVQLETLQGQSPQQLATKQFIISVMTDLLADYAHRFADQIDNDSTRAFYRLLQETIKQGERSLQLLDQELAEQDRANKTSILTIRNLATGISKELRRTLSLKLGFDPEHETAIDLEKFTTAIKNKFVQTAQTIDDSAIQALAQALYQTERYIQKYHPGATNIEFNLTSSEYTPDGKFTFTYKFINQQKQPVIIDFTIINLYKGSKEVTCIADIADKAMAEPTTPLPLQSHDAEILQTSIEATETREEKRRGLSSSADDLLKLAQKGALSGTEAVKADAQQYRTSYTPELIAAIEMWGKGRRPTAQPGFSETDRPASDPSHKKLPVAGR